MHDALPLYPGERSCPPEACCSNASIIHPLVARCESFFSFSSGVPLSTRGLLYLVGAALLFSVMTLLVKWGGESMPSAMMVFARGVVTTIFGLLWLRHIRQPLWGSRRPLLWLRGAFGLTGLLGFFSALTLLPLAVATILHSINPILTTIFAAFFLGERVRPSFWLALAAAFGGVLLVIQPQEIMAGTSLSPVGVAAALIGSCGAAAAYVSVRKLRESDHPLVMVFYFSLVTTAGALPFALEDWVWPAGYQWWVLLAIGIVTQLAQVLLTRGLALVPAGPATSIGYLQVVLAVVWGALLFAEIPAASTLMGAALILLATAWIAFAKGRVPIKNA